MVTVSHLDACSRDRPCATRQVVVNKRASDAATRRESFSDEMEASASSFDVPVQCQSSSIHEIPLSVYGSILFIHRRLFWIFIPFVLFCRFGFHHRVGETVLFFSASSSFSFFTLTVFFLLNTLHLDLRVEWCRHAA